MYVISTERQFSFVLVKILITLSSMPLNTVLFHKFVESFVYFTQFSSFKMKTTAITFTWKKLLILLSVWTVISRWYFSPSKSKKINFAINWKDHRKLYYFQYFSHITIRKRSELEQLAIQFSGRQRRQMNSLYLWFKS